MKRLPHNTWKQVLLCYVHGAAETFRDQRTCEKCVLRAYCTPLWKRIKSFLDKNEEDN